MDAQQVTNIVGWQLLGTMLGLSSDALAKYADALAKNANANPSKSEVWESFSGTISDYKVEDGQIGIQFGQDGPSLFVKGKLTISKLSSEPVDFLAVFSSGGAVISGTINESLEVPIIKLQLTDPLLVISVDPEGIPTPGVGGDLDLASSLESSFLMLLISAGEGKGLDENSVFIASVSELTVTAIVEAIAQVHVPGEVASLLDIVKLTHFKDENFSIDASLAGDLDAEELANVAVAFKNVGGVDLPTTLNQVVLVVRTEGEKWSITNLQDTEHRHYQLAKGDGGIQVTVDPQIYCVPQDTEFAGNTFDQGCWVKGRVDVFGLGGQATVGMNPVALDADLDKIVLKDERLFSIASATDSRKGPHLSYATIPSTDPNKPQWPNLSGDGGPHFDLDAKVTLLDLSTTANVKISTQQLTCEFSVGTDGVEVSGSASFPSPKLSANVAIDAGSVNIPLFGSVDIGKISAGLTITADDAKFDEFSVSVLGVGFTIPGTEIPIPVGSTFAGLASTVSDKIRDKVLGYFDYLDPTKLARQAVQYLKDIGEEVGHFFSSGFGLGGSYHSDPPPPDPNNTTSDQITYFIWDNLNRKSVMGMREHHDLGSFPAIGWVKYYGGYGFAPPRLIEPLRLNGYAAGDVGAAIATVYKLEHPGIVGLWLAQAGYDIDTVVDCLRFRLNLDRDDAVSTLRNGGYAVTTHWPEPGRAYLIAAVGGLSSDSNGVTSRFLYANADNTLSFIDKDDNSLRQLWWFEKRPAGDWFINPVGGGGMRYRYLSCQRDLDKVDGRTAGSLVDVYSTHDDSGRQYWTLTPTGDGSFTMTIETEGALEDPAFKYLSTGSYASGTRFDLWTEDDGSGRQQWRLLPWPATDGTEYLIQNMASPAPDAGIYLRPADPSIQEPISPSTPGAQGAALALTRSADDAGTHWTFERVADGVFRIRPVLGLSYLSCDWDSNRGDNLGSMSNLWCVDDNSGRQHWTLITAGGFGNCAITIETKDALKKPDYKYLSCSSDGTVIDLWNSFGRSEAGRQRWVVYAVPPV